MTENKKYTVIKFSSCNFESDGKDRIAWVLKEYINLITEEYGIYICTNNILKEVGEMFNIDPLYFSLEMENGDGDECDECVDGCDDSGDCDGSDNGDIKFKIYKFVFKYTVIL